MEKEIVIRSIEHEPTQTGKDKWAVGTSLGFMSVWDKELAETLSTYIGKKIMVNVLEKGKYQNIISILTGLDGNGEPVTSQSITPKSERLNSFKMDKDKSITAQCLTKCVMEVCILKEIEEAPKYVLETYQYFLKNL